MKLDHIRDEVCPKCGAEVVSESRDYETNSGIVRGEQRSFFCGLNLAYQESVRHELGMCSKEPSHLAKIEQRKSFLINLFDFIREGATDDLFKMRIGRALRAIDSSPGD